MFLFPRRGTWSKAPAPAVLVTVPPVTCALCAWRHGHRRPLCQQRTGGRRGPARRSAGPASRARPKHRLRAAASPCHLHRTMMLRQNEQSGRTDPRLRGLALSGRWRWSVARGTTRGPGLTTLPIGQDRRAFQTPFTDPAGWARRRVKGSIRARESRCRLERPKVSGQGQAGQAAQD